VFEINAKDKSDKDLAYNFTIWTFQHVFEINAKDKSDKDLAYNFTWLVALLIKFSYLTLSPFPLFGFI
jgi:hypothetical protein